jgi:ABC-type multidrug transport system ATPase subunit
VTFMQHHLKVSDLVYGGFGPVSFELSGGECVGVFGESGCGKTRLLRALADLDPHSGSVALDGEEAAALPASQWRRRVAYLPAESPWWFDRVADHFAVPPESAQLQSLGLPETILGTETRALSSGEKQRLALLRLLCNRPPVLLLDEVTAHLDADRAELTERKIMALMQDGGAAVVWVSHNIAQLRRVCSRILFMAQGGAIVKTEARR